MSDGVSIALIRRGDDDEFLGKRLISIFSIVDHPSLKCTLYLDSTSNKTDMQLSRLTEALEVVVTFNAQMNRASNGNHWCDDIEIFIQYDTT